MTPYRACDVELAARVSKLALSFSSQNIRLPLHQCIVSPLRLLPFFSSFLFLVAEQGSIYARRPPSFLSLSPSLLLSLFFTPRLVCFKIFFLISAPRPCSTQRPLQEKKKRTIESLHARIHPFFLLSFFFFSRLIFSRFERSRWGRYFFPLVELEKCEHQAVL